MSVHVFFSFSSGLKSPLFVPKGTKEGCIAHVTDVERKLGIARTQYLDNSVQWDTAFKWDIKAIDDALLCETVLEHNDWVRSLYESFGEWSQEPIKDGETLTPQDAQEFWFGLEILDVPIEKWTEDYYRNRMEHLYEVMRGRDSEGVSFDTKGLTPRQAAEVIILFSEYLDEGDIRLDVPAGHDELAASSDGGYEWCEKCGKAIDPDDIDGCHRKQCPLKKGVE
jgi:hypothetical protein